MSRSDWLITILLWVGAVLLGIMAVNAATNNNIVVDWETASEFNTFGFNLYRGESPQGPFVKVNSAIIPASTDPLAGGKYSFTDKGVTAGKTYYYQLEEISSNKDTHRFDSIEVRAGDGGILEGILAVLLMAAGGLSILINRRKKV